MTSSAAVLWLALFSSTPNVQQAGPPDARKDGDSARSQVESIRWRAYDGDASAQRQLGDAYAKGEGVRADRKEAEYWYLAASGQGDYQAQVRLAEMLRGKGKKQKIDALTLLTIAAAIAPPQEHEGIAQQQLALSHELKAKESLQAIDNAKAWLEAFKRQPPTPTRSTPKAFHAGEDGVSSPQLVRQTRPAYTEQAMRKKVQGVVIVTGVVMVDGSLAYVRVARSLDQQYGLDQEAVKAARQWRFMPGMKDGAPVPVQIAIELTFTLK